MKKLNVFVGCERSGVVAGAFRGMGHNAWSCDLRPAADDHPCAEYHLQGDVRHYMNYLPWDIGLFFPDCTFLTVSGLHWNARGRVVDGRPRSELTEEALAFVRELMNCGIPKWQIENPVGCISTRICKPTQIIQPYQYGHDASKKTCLWLHGLPPLTGTRFVPPRLVCGGCGKHLDYDQYVGPCAFMLDCEHCGAEPSFFRPRWSNQTDSGQNKLAPSDDRADLRSRTYEGIANAMAEQWGGRAHA